MNDYKTIFKAKARNKDLTSADMIAYAILKTMSAKSEEKQPILNNIISKSFTAGKVCEHRIHPYQAVHLASKRTSFLATSRFFGCKIFNTQIEDFLNTEEEIAQFLELAKSLYNYEGVKCND